MEQILMSGQENVHSEIQGLLSYDDVRAPRVWAMFYAGHIRMLDQYANFINPAYLESIEAIGFCEDRTPTLRELRSALAPFGWDVVPVVGYINGETLANRLYNLQFPLSLPIRSEQFIEHSPMPDFIHVLPLPFNNAPRLICNQAA